MVWAYATGLAIAIAELRARMDLLKTTAAKTAPFQKM
jgi:hypothetical protein